MKLLLCFLLCIIIPPAVADTVDLGDFGTFHIDVPKGWRFSSSKAGTVGYATTLTPTNDANAKCLLTLAFLPRPASLAKDKIEAEVRNMCAEFVEKSVEKQIVLRSFGVKTGYGAYCVLTDTSLVGKPPEVDNHKVLGSGIIRFTDRVMAVVSVFSDDAEGVEFKSMLEALSTAAVTIHK